MVLCYYARIGDVTSIMLESGYRASVRSGRTDLGAETCRRAG
jgi:hypothetical protein